VGTKGLGLKLNRIGSIPGCLGLDHNDRGQDPVPVA